MSILSSANVTDVNLELKERTHMRLCINMLIFTHNLGNWLIVNERCTQQHTISSWNLYLVFFRNSSQLLSSVAGGLTCRHWLLCDESEGRLKVVPPIIDIVSLSSSRHKRTTRSVSLIKLKQFVFPPRYSVAQSTDISRTAIFGPSV